MTTFVNNCGGFYWAYSSFWRWVFALRRYYLPGFARMAKGSFDRHIFNIFSEIVWIDGQHIQLHRLPFSFFACYVAPGSRRFVLRNISSSIRADSSYFLCLKMNQNQRKILPIHDRINADPFPLLMTARLLVAAYDIIRQPAPSRVKALRCF